jgi:ABC-type polysaccharide/polyol phosphate export permease
LRTNRIFGSVIDNRALVWEMALRDLRGATRGTIVGHAWLIVSPLLQTVGYVLIVTWVFRVRLEANSGPFDYALYVLAGMAPWQFVSRSLQESSTLIRDRMELVKQVVYPIETLPATSIVVNSIGPLLTLVVFLALAVVAGKAAWTWLLLPVPMLLTACLVLGVSWLFSIVGVVLKDLREVLAVVFALLIFASPVILSEAMTGERLWTVVMLNPLSHIVICFRDVLEARFHPVSWLVLASMCLAMLALGSWVMRRTKVLINEYI